MAEDPIEEREEEREDEEEMFLGEEREEEMFFGEDDLDVPDISSSSKLTQADCSIFHRVSVSTGGDCQHTSLENTAAQCAVQCAVCSVQCAVCSVQCAVCSVQCAVCSVQSAVCSAVCNMLYSSDELSFSATQMFSSDFKKSVNQIPDNN